VKSLLIKYSANPSLSQFLDYDYIYVYIISNRQCITNEADLYQRVQLCQQLCCGNPDGAFKLKKKREREDLIIFLSFLE